MWQMRFEGKILFATGAGSGIAAATARRFTDEGGRVAVIDVNAGRAGEVAGELEGAIGVACDVSSEQAVAAAVAEVHDAFGRIDGVLNAAGQAIQGPIETFALEDFERTLAVHVIGTFLVCRAVVPIMREGGGGSIVNISSVGAIMATPLNGAYSAAKGAIASYTRQLALDLADDGIRVNAVLPGRTKTGMTMPLWTERGNGDYEKGAAVGSQRSMQKRVAEPEEIAALACFLLADESSFITGSLHVADGGESAQ
jgi:NAD(P)-dependent dehydrogenase (short-subunit alcohol dehydrogenase family)